MCAGRQPALFVGAAIHDEIQRLLAQFKKVQQRAALGRGTVSRDRFALLFELREQGAQRPFDFQHARGKALVIRQRADALGLFIGQQGWHRGFDAVRAGVAGEQAQRSAVDGQFFNAENFQSVPREQRLQRREREIENVLVVNRVELGVFDEIHAVGKFQNDPAAVA